jgi:hypothetical protein
LYWSFSGFQSIHLLTGLVVNPTYQNSSEPCFTFTLTDLTDSLTGILTAIGCEKIAVQSNLTLFASTNTSNHH